MFDEELFTHLNRIATEIPLSKFSSQAIANILNANAKVSLGARGRRWRREWRGEEDEEEEEERGDEER
eukprot:519597-Hanusia_phi.AAC.1